MSSFMSRFGSKKTSESPAAAQSRNHGSVGPIKANSQALQNQSRLNTSSQNYMTTNIGTANMYVITTDMDYPNKKNQKFNNPIQNTQMDMFVKQEIEQLRDQIKDLETNLNINKEIIKNLLESQAPNPNTTGGGQNQTLQQVLQSLQRENALLQGQVQKLTLQRNEAQDKLKTQSGQSNSMISSSITTSGPHARESSVSKVSAIEREKMQNLEKQNSEMKALILHKEQLANQKELAYNEVLQICARYAKNDKALMTKLRELKFKYADGSGASTSMNGPNTLQTQNNLTGATAPDEVESQTTVSLIQENQNLKKDLDFASAEIERLRSKLIIEDFDMPPLSSELFGLNSKERSYKLNESMENQSDLVSQEFLNLKDQITQKANQNNQSRNVVDPGRNKTASSSFIGNQVPKLDFKRLKKVQEFKDWYTYASKLEDSVKYLRQRIKSIEEDNDQLNIKFRKEQANKEHLFSLNEKLNKALKRANVKIAEVKDKYKQKVSKKCYYCNNDLEISMNYLNSTLDQVQITEMNTSFLMPNTSSGPVIQDDDSFGDRLANDGEGDDIGNVNLLDNLEIDENAGQTESDKLRQQQMIQQQKKVIMRGQGVKMSASNQNDARKVEGQMSRNHYNTMSHQSAPINNNMLNNSHSQNKMVYKIKKESIIQQSAGNSNQPTPQQQQQKQMQFIQSQFSQQLS